MNILGFYFAKKSDVKHIADKLDKLEAEMQQASLADAKRDGQIESLLAMSRTTVNYIQQVTGKAQANQGQEGGVAINEG